MNKRCTQCQTEKDLGCFGTLRSSRDGLREVCKECRRDKYVTDRDRILQRAAVYRAAHSSEINQRARDDRKRRPEHYRRRDQQAYQRDSRKRERCLAYYYRNKDKVRARYNERRRTDVQFRLAQNLRTRLNRSIKIHQKSGSAVRDLGCSIAALKAHLERQFREGMSWSNYGTWHIDHIAPLSRFDLTDREQLLKACHYTNLQPLWANDNIAKSDRVVEVAS